MKPWTMSSDSSHMSWFSTTNNKWVSKWASRFLTAHQHKQTIQWHSRTPVHAGKYTTKDKSKTDTTKIKLDAEKANNAKYSKTKLPWFGHLLRHSARIQGGLILQLPNPHEAHKSTKADYVNCSGPVYETTQRQTKAARQALTVAQRWLMTWLDWPVDDDTLLTDIRLELLSRRADDAENWAMLDTVRFMSFCGVFFRERARLTRLPNLHSITNSTWI